MKIPKGYSFRGSRTERECLHALLAKLGLTFSDLIREVLRGKHARLEQQARREEARSCYRLLLHSSHALWLLQAGLERGRSATDPRIARQIAAAIERNRSAIARVTSGLQRLPRKSPTRNRRPVD